LTPAANRADHHTVKAFALALTLVSSVIAVGCMGGGDKSVTPVDMTSCADVFYEGEGEPDAIIVSDVSQGFPPAPTKAAMVRVIKGVLGQRGFRAGTYRVGYQSCGTDADQKRACERNAKSYAAAKDVLGVIGPYYSSCAAVQIPILSRRAAGPLAMVSPTNTDPGLTLNTPNSDHDPGALYPDGVRNYVRVVPPDNAIGAAAATLAKQRGAERVIAFVNREPHSYRWYGPAVGAGFVETARSLGLVTTELEWRDQESYTAIAKRAAAARPQLVFFAGNPLNNAKRLLEDVRRQVGPDVEFAAGDLFLAAAKELGPVGEGLHGTGSYLVLESLTPAGRRFLRSVRVSPELAFNSGFAGPAEAAPATEMLLEAIARSNGTRASVVEKLFETRLKGGTLRGSFSFDRRGDITPARIAVFTIRNGAVVVDGVVRVLGRADD
jgi:branched-chain amino acid transport system substrate-binding protein